MGLINNDVFQSSNGVEKAGSYLSFNNETLYLSKATNGSYAVRANYRIFWSKAIKDAGKPFLELRTVSALVSEAELANNLYGVLYAELKKQYPNSVDELDVPAEQPAASEPAAVEQPASEPAPAEQPASEPAPAEQPASQ